MQKQSKDDMTLLARASLALEKYGTTAISTIIKKDKDTSAIYSLYNIPYSQDKTDTKRQFDWHCPRNIAGTSHPTPTPTLFYIHGGSWTAADKSIFTLVAKDFAEQGLIVININYRLLPDVEFADVYNDVAECITYCVQNAEMFGIDKQQIFVGGDSAGGHLSSLVASNWHLGNLKLDCTIKGCLLFYGVFDISHLHKLSFRACRSIGKYFEEKYRNEPEILEKFYHDYSPLQLATQNFPPCFVTAGEIDSLTKTESLPFIQRLKELGVECETLIFPRYRRDARHAFINLRTKARSEAMNEAYKFLHSHITTPLDKLTSHKSK